MDLADKDLQELVATGKSQGYLTYDQVNEYLPDEAVNPDKLDNLLMALEDQGIELVNEAPEPEFVDPPQMLAENDDREVSLGDAMESDAQTEGPRLHIPDEAKWSDDPVRMYLTQMAEIPLLTRDEEIALAKKIEITRKRFRRNRQAARTAL